MNGLKEKNKFSEPPQTVEEENEDSSFEDSAILDAEGEQSDAGNPPLDQLFFEPKIEMNDEFAQERLAIDRYSSQATETDKSQPYMTDFTIQMLCFIPKTILKQLIAHTQGSSLPPQVSFNLQKAASTMQKTQSSLPPSDTEQKPLVPLSVGLNSVVLVAELRNFYNISFTEGSGKTEQQNLEQTLGFQRMDDDECYRNELLVEVLDKFLDTTVQYLTHYGGDLIQFAGNSIVAIWPSGDADTPDSQCTKATQCALELLKAVQKHNCEIAFGIGQGEYQILHLGGVLKRIEFFVAGETLQNALYCLRQTTKEKPVAVSAEVWKHIENICTGEPEIQSAAKNQSQKPKPDLKVKAKCYFVKKVDNLIKSNRVQRDEDDLPDKKIKTIENLAKSYIPGGFRSLNNLKNIHGQSTGQHMNATLLYMAIDLGNEIFDPKKPEGKQVLQSIIEIVQTQVYRLEGSMTKAMVYENGLIFVATWGIQMLQHCDDPQRAIFTAHNIKKQLASFQSTLVDEESFEEPPFHAGIATGYIFQGVIGTGARREICLVGPTVERAMILMQTAIKHYSRIYCDYLTKQMASHCIDMDYIEHLSLPNKALNQEVYQPNFSVTIEEKDVFGNNLRTTTAQSQSKLIKLHSNPFFLDRDNNYQKNFSEVYGKARVITKIVEDIQTYVRQQALEEVKQDSIWALAVRGPLGSGKSLFSRRLIIETSTREKQILRPLMAQYNSKFCFQYIVSTCNQDISLKFLGAWRPFLRHLLSIYSDFMGQSQEYTINSQILHGTVDDKVLMVEEIFGLKHLAKTKVQIPLDPALFGQQSVKQTKTALRSESMYSLWGGIEAQKFQEDYENSLVSFCLNFILHAIDTLRQSCCFFFLIDNASLMNHSSWLLFGLVTQNVNFLVMVLNMETRVEYFEKIIDKSQQVSQLNFKLLKDQDTLVHYRDVIAPKERDIFNIADMTPLTKKEFKQAMLDLALFYQRDFEIEIEDLTTKTKEKIAEQGKDALQEKYQSKEQRQRYMKEQLQGFYQTNTSFKDVSDEVLEMALNLSQGNPLFAFWYMYQALIKGFLVIRDNKIMPSVKFKKAVAFDFQWTCLQMPCIVYKSLCQLLESKLTTRDNGRRRMDNTEVYQLLKLMQEAAVIGPLFSSKLLANITKRNIEVELVNQNLDVIEDSDLIEMVYNEVQTGERYYRFNFPLMRTALYQMQCFNTQRKPVLKQIIAYMKENIIFNKITEWNLEKEFYLMLRYIMENFRVMQEDQLDRKVRQVMVVKRLNQRVCKNCRILQNGYGRAKFEGHVTSDFQDYVIVLNKKRLEFYKKKDNGQLEPQNDDKGSLAWGIKTFKNNRDYVLSKMFNISDIIKIKESEKVATKEKGIFSVLNPLQLGVTKHEPENANQKSDTIYSISIKVLSKENKNKQNLSVTIQPISNRKQDVIECENWLAAIEFLRTKFQFDTFAQNYGSVAFPLRQVDFQGAARAHTQERQINVPLKVLINDMKSTQVYSLIPSAQMYGTYNVFNQTSSQLLPQVNPLMDPASRLRTLPSTATLQSNYSQAILANRTIQAKQINLNKQSVEKLAKKIKTLFNVTYLSFLGHIQAATHASINQDFDVQKPVLGVITPLLQTQFKRQIEEVLDFGFFQATPKTLQTVQSLKIDTKSSEFRTELLVDTLRLKDEPETHESNDDAASIQTFVDHAQSAAKFEAPPTTTLVEDNQMNLFREDLRAPVSRLRDSKKFVHGQRLIEAQLTKSGDAHAEFQVQRRFDKAGYNERKKPFIEQVQKVRKGGKMVNKNNQLEGSAKSILSLQNEFKLPGSAKRKEKGQVIEKILENSNKPWYIQPQPSGHDERSSEQRKEHTDSKRSSVYQSSPNPASKGHNSHNISRQQDASPKFQGSQGKNTAQKPKEDLDNKEPIIFRNEKGAFMSVKRQLSLDNDSQHLSLEQRSRKPSSPKNLSKVSSKRIFSLLREQEPPIIIPEDFKENMIERVEADKYNDQIEKAYSAVREKSGLKHSIQVEEQEVEASFNDYNNLSLQQQEYDQNDHISHLTFDDIEENQRESNPSVHSVHSLQSLQHPSHHSQHAKPNLDQIEQFEQKVVQHDPFANRGKPAIVVAEGGAPCIVLTAVAHKKKSQQKVVLKYNDVVFIDRDLFGSETESMLLTKCYLFKEGGVKVDLVIARDLIRPISDEEVAHLNAYVDDPAIVPENSFTEQSQDYQSSRIDRKFVHETSADNLLRQSPTSLDFYLHPVEARMVKNNAALNEISHQLDQMKQPTSFTKLQKRRIERKQAQQYVLSTSYNDFSAEREQTEPVYPREPQFTLADLIHGKKRQSQSPNFELQTVQRELSSSCDEQQSDKNDIVYRQIQQQPQRRIEQRQSQGIVQVSAASAVPVALKVNERRKKKQQTFGDMVNSFQLEY